MMGAPKASCLGALNKCFVAGTPVHLKDKTKSVEKVKIGDSVVSRDPKTGKTELRKVIGTRIRYADKILTLNFGNLETSKKLDAIQCTPEHPFYVAGKGFTAAGDLKVGDVIVTQDGPNVKILSITTKNLKKAIPVYNLTIEGDHSYFVGTANGGEWVHNYGGGIYAFVDKATGLPYVGKSIDLASRTGRWASAGRNASPIDTLAFPGGTSNLAFRIAEQQMINDLGGISSGNLANKINSIAEKYWATYGITPP